jgi:hypothetical protein
MVKFCKDFGLNMDNLCGQGYDGASNMSGHTGRLQALIKLHHFIAGTLRSLLWSQAELGGGGSYVCSASTLVIS